MNLYLQLALAGLAGCLLGWMQFRGLLETLRRLPLQRRPGLWMLASLLTRMTIMLAGLGTIVHFGSWPALLAALAGILLMRTSLQRRVGTANPKGAS